MMHKHKLLTEFTLYNHGVIFTQLVVLLHIILAVENYWKCVDVKMSAVNRAGWVPINCTGLTFTVILCKAEHTFVRSYKTAEWKDSIHGYHLQPIQETAGLFFFFLDCRRKDRGCEWHIGLLEFYRQSAVCWILKKNDNIFYRFTKNKPLLDERGR